MSDIKQQILNALSQVDDPDLKRDIVSLGMVQDLKIENHKVSFTLVLTTPACPFKDTLARACTTAIQHMVDKNFEVDIKFDSKVSSAKNTNAAQLAGVKNLIAVASGKGGVGKSTVAANLAISMAKLGAKVGLVDADIYGPSLPIMFGLTKEQPLVKQDGQKITIIPFEKYGIKLMSVGSLIEEHQALAWRGPMITQALRQLLTDVAWEDLDYLFVDMPPGTGDIYLTLSQQFPLSAAIFVTTPQAVAVADTRKSIEMLRMPAINIPILGIVENMSWFTPLNHPDEKYYIFGQGGGELLSKTYGYDLLTQLPLVVGTASQSDEGKLPVLESNHPLSNLFESLAGEVARKIAIINA